MLYVVKDLVAELQELAPNAMIRFDDCGWHFHHSCYDCKFRSGQKCTHEKRKDMDIPEKLPENWVAGRGACAYSTPRDCNEDF